MTQQTSPSDVARIFDAELRDPEPVPPRFNCAPTDPLTVVVEREDGRVVERHRWGLIPAWAASPSEGSRRINARAETVAESPAFRVAFRRRRCLVPADGFYEWQRIDGRRQPWHVRRSDGAPMAMAGLWSLWRDPATGEWVASCAVVTTTPNDVVAALHDRMPVLLSEEARSIWLDPTETSAGLLRDLLVPSDPDELELFPVSSLVNSVRNEGEELIVPLAAEVPRAAPRQATLFG